MRLIKFIFLSIVCVACNDQSNKLVKNKSQSQTDNLTVEMVKAQLGAKYDLSVASLNANHGLVFHPIAYDTTIIGKYKIQEIQDKKTLEREIEPLAFDQKLVDKYHFESMPGYTLHFINYVIDCNAPLVRTAVKVDESCHLSLISKDGQTGYMVNLPLFKIFHTEGYYGQVTSEIKGCEIKRVIKETFGTATSYEVNGVNVLPKRRTEEVYNLGGNGHLVFIDSQSFDTYIEFFR